jgi:tetratricopeptide (TPR) repeat protein
MKHLLLFLVLAAGSLPLYAQEGGLPVIVDNSIKAMSEGKWEQALELNTQAVAIGQDPETALQLYGARFGSIYYRKGLCELKLSKFVDAIRSFEICYQVFSDAGNQFNKMSLLKWGEAAFGMEDYELAITQWKKFIAERDRAKDLYPQGSFHVSMAIANFRLGELQTGIEHLEIAIKNKNVFPTPNEAIATGFQAFATATIVSKNEQALIDFTNKNRGYLTIEPYAMQKFSSFYLNLAGQALKSEMPESAMILYQFVPSTQAVIDDIGARIADMGKLPRIPNGNHRLDKAALEEQLAKAEEAQSSQNTVEAIKLSATAFIHESYGNAQGAYACYLQLETYFPGAEKREANLYNLIRISSYIERIEDTLKYGKLFLTMFPDSEERTNVYKLMLTGLFYDAKYATCIDIGSDIIDNKRVEKNTVEHDLVSFVLAASYFYTGDYEKAKPLLEEHTALYSVSPFSMTAAYLHAANLSRLGDFKKAIVLLDSFIERFKSAKNQTYIPLAIFDRANIYYMQEEYDRALVEIARLIKDFPNTNTTDQAYNLRGSVLQMQEKIQDAEKAYLKAFELAEQRGNAALAGEALFSLVALLKDTPEGEDELVRAKQAAGYADIFWKKYSTNSPYVTQMAIDQAAPLELVGRGDEALKQLQGVISQMAKLADAKNLEAAINAYTKLYLNKHTPDQLKEHYYHFPGILIADKAANALLRIALIGVYEEIPKNEKDPDKLRSAQAMITVLFQGLKKDFALKDLSSLILIKLGDYLRTNTASPREALPFYDEAFSRNDAFYRFAALLGRADIYGQSEKGDDLANAIKDFELIFAESSEKPQREFALFRIIEILMKKGDFDAVAKRANIYLNKEKGESLGFRKYESQVGFMLAQSFDKRGMVDDAISMYVKVWGAHMGKISISAPAIETWMTLSFKRNRPSVAPNILSDRQSAYEGGYRYLELTGRSKERFNPADLALWQRVEKLTAQYEADPSIKTMAQIQKEKEQSR